MNKRIAILIRKLTGEKNGESGAQNLVLDREPKYTVSQKSSHL